MKDCLTRSPVLSHPDLALEFVLETDASDFGIGGALTQVARDGEVRFIGFYSKSLSGSQSRYSTTSKELFAVVKSIEYFKTYLWVQKFTLITDHRALVFLFTQKHPTPMMEKWMDVLLEFDFRLVFRPGSENLLSDTLSRIVRRLGLQDDVEPLGANLSNDEKADLISKAHDLGHFGAASMVKKLQADGYVWANMRRDCAAIATACMKCARWTVG